MDAESLTLRPLDATTRDGAVALISEGFEGYRSIAPPGWVPPDDAAAQVDVRLTDPGQPGVVALDGDEAVGVVGFTVQVAGRAVEPEGGIGELWALFVAPAWWGTGLATRLHAVAIDGMRESGHQSCKLFTAAGHARARGFYAREGWAPAGATFSAHDLEMVELRRPLRGRPEN